MTHMLRKQIYIPKRQQVILALMRGSLTREIAASDGAAGAVMQNYCAAGL